jgi:hypothetical protein
MKMTGKIIVKQTRLVTLDVAFEVPPINAKEALDIVRKHEKDLRLDSKDWPNGFPAENVFSEKGVLRAVVCTHAGEGIESQEIDGQKWSEEPTVR